MTNPPHFLNLGCWFHNPKKPQAYLQLQVHQWRRKMFHYIVKNHYNHRPSNQGPNFPDYIMGDFDSLNFIVSHPLLPSVTVHSLKKLIYSFVPLRNHSLLQPPSARLQIPYNHQPTKTNQMQNEPEPFCGKCSMKLDSHPNFIVRFTTLSLSTNTLIELLIAWVLEDFLCMCRSGITGPAGANVIRAHQQRHLFHWSWITYMLPITSNEKRTPSHQEPGWWHISKHYVGWLSNLLPVFGALQSQTVSDFLKSQTRIPFERSEATPIPLAVLAAWERRILSDDLTHLSLKSLHSAVSSSRKLHLQLGFPLL